MILNADGNYVAEKRKKFDNARKEDCQRGSLNRWVVTELEQYLLNFILVYESPGVLVKMQVMVL